MLNELGLGELIQRLELAHAIHAKYEAQRPSTTATDGYRHTHIAHIHNSKLQTNNIRNVRCIDISSYCSVLWCLWITP